MAAEKEDDMLTIMEELITRYPQLGVCRGEVEEACRALIRCFSTGHKRSFAATEEAAPMRSTLSVS